MFELVEEFCDRPVTGDIMDPGAVPEYWARPTAAMVRINAGTKIPAILARPGRSFEFDGCTWSFGIGLSGAAGR